MRLASSLFKRRWKFSAARWRKQSGEPLWKEWVKKNESKGHPEAARILDATLEMLKN